MFRRWRTLGWCSALACLFAVSARAEFIDPTIDKDAGKVDLHMSVIGNMECGLGSAIATPQVFPDSEGGYYYRYTNYRQYLQVTPSGEMRWYEHEWITYGPYTREAPGWLLNEEEPLTWTTGGSVINWVNWLYSVRQSYGTNFFTSFLTTSMANGQPVHRLLVNLLANPGALGAIQHYSVTSLFHIMMWQEQYMQRSIDIWQLDLNDSGLVWWRNRVVLQNPDWNGDALTNEPTLETPNDPAAPMYIQGPIYDDDGNLITPPDNYAWDVYGDTVLANAGSDQTVEAGAGGVAQVSLAGSGSSSAQRPLTFVWTSDPPVLQNVTGATATVSLPLGSYTITLTVSNDQGQSATDAVLVVVRDTTAPVLSGVPAAVVVEQSGLAGTAVALEVPSASDLCDAAPTVTSDAPAVFPLGVTTVTFTAVDASGNVAQATTTVTVADTTPPTFSNVPAAVAVEQAGLSGTAVSVPLPTVSDVCDAAPLLTSDAPAVFPLGTTVVTFTATDASGNVAKATTSVTVADTQAPVLSGVPAAITVEQLTRDGTEATLALPTAADICDAAPVVASDAPAVFPLGTTVVTFTATDASGNVASATTTVTVVDTRAPVFGGAPTPVTVEQANRNGTAVTLVPPAVTDVCDAAPVVTSNAPAVFPLGATVVTFTATDASGNAATATVTVTVVDTTAPVLSNVPAPITAKRKGSKGTPVTVPLPTATDICDAAPVIASDAPALFPEGATVVTFTATDASGNVSKASTTVTVQKNGNGGGGKTLLDILTDLLKWLLSLLF